MLYCGTQGCCCWSTAHYRGRHQEWGGTEGESVSLRRGETVAREEDMRAGTVVCSVGGNLILKTMKFGIMAPRARRFKSNRTSRRESEHWWVSETVCHRDNALRVAYFLWKTTVHGGWGQCSKVIQGVTWRGIFIINNPVIPNQGYMERLE